MNTRLSYVMLIRQVKFSMGLLFFWNNMWGVVKLKFFHGILLRSYFFGFSVFEKKE